MARTYEVTVPLTVTVKVAGNGRTTVTEAEIESGYPGFFSEAEEAGGCWLPVSNEWTWDADAQRAAWQFTREALAAHSLMNAKIKEANRG